MRIERVVAQLEKELSFILAQEIGDPRLGLITITRIVLTPDLKEATVFFSCLGEKQQVLNTLLRAKGFIRSCLARRIRIRHIPELDFRFDDSLEYSQHINKLFDEINKDHKE
jgi:ribosome-binding factor A